MYNDLNKKIDILKLANTDDTRFIVKILEAYIKNQNSIEIKKLNSSIVSKDTISNNSQENIIDLDKIDVTPYFYTRMRIALNNIVDKVCKTDQEIIIKNPHKFCKSIVNENNRTELGPVHTKYHHLNIKTQIAI